MSSSQAIAGVVIGLVLGAGGTYALSTYLVDAAADCGGICGEGTVCEAGRCELAVEDEAEVAVEPAEAEGKSKSRKGRRKRGAGSPDEDSAELEGGGPPIDDDSHVPRFRADADQTISMSDGTGRLSDAEIDRELAKLDGKFQACVRDAMARVPSLGTGTVKYSFGVAGTGKVTGVTASAPSNLEDAGIVACVRLAVYRHQFPAFDGPTMKASSSISID